MHLGQELDILFDQVSEIAPDGYAAGLKMRFSGPALMRDTYPKAWTTVYSESLMAYWDPVVVWALANTGTTRWSDLHIPDPMGVLKKAREFGLNYGVVISTGKISMRSMLGMARADREFTDEEIRDAVELFDRIHGLVIEKKTLTQNQADALRLIAGGDLHSAASVKLGISESALKARLKSARTRLNARSTAEAITRAKEQNLL